MIKRILITIIITILIALFCAFAFFIWATWAMSRPHTLVSQTPVSLAEFTKRMGGLNFPTSAKNIYYGWSSVGMGGRAHIFRFEAEIEDCVTFAKAEFNRYNEMLYDDPEEYPPCDLVPIESVTDDEVHKPDLSYYGLTKLDWFDVDQIEEGLTIPREKAHHPYIWIDTKRGLLYSYWTD